MSFWRLGDLLAPLAGELHLDAGAELLEGEPGAGRPLVGLPGHLQRPLQRGVGADAPLLAERAAAGGGLRDRRRAPRPRARARASARAPARTAAERITRWLLPASGQRPADRGGRSLQPLVSV